MKQNVYSIYDKVAQVYHNPWVDASDATASRAFQFVCSDEKTMYGMCPADFVLYRVAMFNDKSGTFCECEMPVKVCDGRPFEEVDDE